MERVVEPEWLDSLPPDHPDAVSSRKDLRRLNGLMNHPAVLSQGVIFFQRRLSLRRLVEWGSGDGTLLLRLIQRLGPDFKLEQLTLVDLHPVITGETFRELNRFAQSVEVKAMDVFDWAESASDSDLVLANLFLHHLPGERLGPLLKKTSARTQGFLTCEPRRSLLPQMAARSLALIGCHPVTRHDAAVSVRAGFNGNELTGLWGGAAEWESVEKRAGLFSHYFQAIRRRSESP